MSEVPGAASTISAKSRYEKLIAKRSPFLQRARECAALTFPAIMPPEGFGASQNLPTPYQSLGARGVRTIASKLLLSLFPAGTPFFNYKVDDQVLEQLGQTRGEIEKLLSRRERATVTELDLCVFRPTAFLTLQHLVVTGNACAKIPTKQDERSKVYRLDQYVTRRDASGILIEAVLLDTTDLASLPKEVKRQLLETDEFKDLDAKDMDERPVELYTHIHWCNETTRWRVFQEAGGILIPGSNGTYLKDELPWLFLRFSAQPGEDYGRSYVEEYLGDLDSLEGLSETLVEGSSASARIIFMVRPGGTTSLKVVSNAKNGDTISGDPDDVGCLQVQKQQDLAVAKSQAEEIATRLSYAFLLHSSIQRKGERVTAEEIRYMASELDDALGGVYTLFAADFQLPAVRLFEKRMEKRLKVEKLPPTVTPVIVSGLEAIGRGHDQANLRAFLQEVITVLTPEIAMKRLNASELLARAAASYGVDAENLILDDETVAQNEQQQVLLTMIQQLGPNGINAMGGMGKEVVKGAMGAQAQLPQ